VAVRISFSSHQSCENLTENFLFPFILRGEILKLLAKERLQVAEAFPYDVYRDIARVHWQQCGDPAIEIGRIVKITVAGGASRLFSMYGLGPDHKGKILVDFVNRHELHLTLNHEYEFRIEDTNPWEN
jgi:hypothetical protein